MKKQPKKPAAKKSALPPKGTTGNLYAPKKPRAQAMEKFIGYGVGRDELKRKLADLTEKAAARAQPWLKELRDQLGPDAYEGAEPDPEYVWKYYDVKWKHLQDLAVEAGITLPRMKILDICR